MHDDLTVGGQAPCAFPRTFIIYQHLVTVLRLVEVAFRGKGLSGAVLLQPEILIGVVAQFL